MRFALLIIELHIFDAGERCLGRESVALGTRIGEKLEGLA